MAEVDGGVLMICSNVKVYTLVDALLQGCKGSNVGLKVEKANLKMCVCVWAAGPHCFCCLVCGFFSSPTHFCFQGYTCHSHDFIQTGAISNGSITSVIVSSTLQQRLARQGFDKINVRALSAISLRPSQTR